MVMNLNMNPVLQLYYQLEPEEAKSTRMKAVLDLFSEIIEEPLFNQLRLVISHVYPVCFIDQIVFMDSHMYGFWL